MSKLDATTQDLFLRIGATSQSRSTKAEALFRRLRFNEQDQIANTLSGSPRKLVASDIDGSPSHHNNQPSHNAMKTAMKSAF